MKGSGDKHLQAHAMTQSRVDDDCKQKPTITEWRALVRRKGVSDSNPQIILGRHAQYNVAVSLETGFKCHIVINHQHSTNVTFSRKTYTEAFPWNGQKLMADERLVNGSSKHFNGLINVFNGSAKISNSFGKCLNGLIFRMVCLTC